MIQASSTLAPKNGDAKTNGAGDDILTLLVVDDEEGPRQSLRIVFKHDYNVLVASSGLEALEIARFHPVHIAILDIMMAGMSGVELLKELKDADQNVEVIMLTAYETLETARNALRCGASDYLNKPFEIKVVREAVARAGQKYRRNAELRGSNERLQSLQGEIDTHLVDEELARTRGDIYASVLHDINSPLTVISGFVELINRSMQDAARVEGPELENIKADLQQLTGQVSRCFEISRRYLGFLNASPTETKHVGVRQVLADLHDLLIKHPRAYGHELVIHDLSPDVNAEINGTDLLQILLNLTINALQSTEQPHRVELKTRPVVSPLELEQFTESDDQRFINREGFVNRGSLLAITIADDGPGIPPDLLKKMFEEKFTTKSPDRGTGLGLSIVKRLIVEANAGIHLRTRIGEGSWFTVLLAVHEP